MANKENIRKWVDALRSGEFTQGHGQLCDGDNKMCCLGVASELYRRETGDGEWKLQGDGVLSPYVRKFVTQFDTSKDFLTQPVREWLGIEDNNPRLTCLTVSDNLPEPLGFESEVASALNDDYNCDFVQIAAAIEETFL